MKRISLLILLIVSLNAISQNVAINTDGSSANSKAILDVKSFEKGVLLPRMTQSERDNISAPPAGLIIYNQTQNKYNYYNGTGWLVLGSNWVDNSGNLNYDLGSVRIGSSTSLGGQLDVVSYFSNRAITANNAAIIPSDFLTGITADIYNSYGAGVWGKVYNASGVSAIAEGLRYGVLGTAHDGGSGVGCYADGTGNALKAKVYGSGKAIITSGPLQFTGINEGSGKVLTSDANGNATWQTSGSSLWSASGNDISNTNSGSILIGSTGYSTGKIEVETTGNLSPIYAKSNAANVSSVLGRTYHSSGFGIAGLAMDNIQSTSPFLPGQYGVLGTAADNGNSIGAFATGTGNALSIAIVNGGTGKAIIATGPLQFTGINEGVGKVLTSDANGNATWQTPSSGGSSNMSAFSHVTSAGNISGNLTFLSYANQSSTDKLIVTHNYGSSGPYITFNYGVYWTGTAWSIYNETLGAMPAGATFNVLVIK